MKRKWLVLGGGFILATALTACAGSGQGHHEAASQSPAGGGQTAEAIYKSNCLSCHGGELEGKIGPALQHIGGKLNRDQIANKIQNGGGGMPSFRSRLSDQDVQTLADWLAAKK